MTSDILNNIINWLDKKPLFWQEIISKILKNEVILESDIALLVQTLKSEVGLINQVEIPSIDFDELREIANNITSENEISLVKVHNIQNISALKEDQILHLGDIGLNVIYGDNGSGKSSYTSIFKQLCHTRGTLPQIKRNIYKENSQDVAQIADIVYKPIVNEDYQPEETVRFENSVCSSNILKSISVFDSTSANHYVEAQGEIAFIPYGISVIEKLSNNVKQVESLINDELKQQKILLDNFDVNSLGLNPNENNYKVINSISSKTDTETLKAQFLYKSEDETNYQELLAQVEKLKKINPKDVIEKNKAKIKRFSFLETKIKNINKELFSNEVFDNAKKAIQKYLTSKETLTINSENLFSGLPIEGIGGESWRQLWESARKFNNQVIQLDSFPEVDVCPLCLQELNDTSKKRFTEFEEFIKNDLQAAYQQCLLDKDKEKKKIDDINTDFTDLELTINEIDEISPDYKEIFQAYINTVDSTKELLISSLDSGQTKDLTFNQADEQVHLMISKVIGDLYAQNKDLDESTIGDQIIKLEKQISDLKEKKVISLNLNKIDTHISTLQSIDKLNECIKRCKTNAITSLSNELTTDYISSKLQESFNEELSKIGFKNLEVLPMTKGAIGKQQFSLKLNENDCGDISLKDILSEGERRCIALAAFFAELSLSDVKNPIIFDDPVSSLDHRWRKKIAERLAEEALTRQVIVFTHDNVFLLLLQECCNNSINALNPEFNPQGLTRGRKETGIITGIPWDAMGTKQRIGHLRNRLVQIRKLYKENGTEEELETSVRFLYGYLREAWERLIEELVLNSTVQRFNRAVQTQRLKKVIDFNESDYSLIEVNMSKCSCVFVGHDEASQIDSEVPNFDEIENDIKILDEFSKEMKKRR